MTNSKEYQRRYRKEHREEFKEYQRNYRKRHPEEVKRSEKKQREKHKKNNQRYMKLYYQEHKERLLRLRKDWRRKLKEEVLTHYGGGKLACVLCSENDVDCLTIDHIKGGGNKQRRALKLSNTTTFYHWLEDTNFPKGYRTLCMNCQFKEKERMKRLTGGGR